MDVGTSWSRKGLCTPGRGACSSGDGRLRSPAMKLVSLVALVAAMVAAQPATAGPCARSSFKTALVKAACDKGGQDAAKDAMKAFQKEKGIKSCNQCHTKLAPSYDLKPDAHDTS
jgi:hypothetical protein